MSEPSNVSHDTSPLPSLREPTNANLIPFAIMCSAWFMPVLKFWALVWGLFRPYDYTGGDVAPELLPFLVGLGICLLPWWLPKAYYQIRPFEQTGRFYHMLGVPHFRKMVPNGDWINAWRRRTTPTFRVISNRAEAKIYLGRTVVGEKSHLVLLLVGIATPLYALHIGWTSWAVYFAITNVIFHLYPILLQRYTRARLVRFFWPARKTREHA